MLTPTFDLEPLKKSNLLRKLDFDEVPFTFTYNSVSPNDIFIKI